MSFDSLYNSNPNLKLKILQDLVDEYSEILLRNVQKDRGLSIPGCPIGCDFEVDDDYSMGKFVKQYESL